jgi:hypothetical protein
MIIKNKEKEKISIDLSSPQGNAFYILGIAKQIGKKLYGNIDLIISDMMSGDYKHLVLTFEKYFGDYVDIIDNDGVLDD